MTTQMTIPSPKRMSGSRAHHFLAWTSSSAKMSTHERNAISTPARRKESVVIMLNNANMFEI